MTAAETMLKSPIRSATSSAPASHPGSWVLDRSLTFLNHGSYGACLEETLDAQAEIRQRMERDPVRFFKVDLERLMDGVRDRLGSLLGCAGGDIAPTQNATVALCTVFNSIDWSHGDEVVVTSHEYSSGVYELERIGERTGIRVVTARLPFPIASPDQAFESVMRSVTGRTRLVVVSHITSATSLVLPVGRIVSALRDRGIEALVDGAHTPGQIPVDISAIGPAYYVGSLHKWANAPKGTGFVYVRRDLQQGFRTVSLSSRAKKIRPDRPLFLRDFDYMGTDDYTGMLAVPAALDALEKLSPGGLPGLMAANRSLVLAARDAVCRGAGLPRSCPDEMTASMVSLPLPEADPKHATRTTLYDDPLQDALVDRHRIQAPVWRLGENPGTRLIRISAQSYNRLEQYERLGEALAAELARER